MARMNNDATVYDTTAACWTRQVLQLLYVSQGPCIQSTSVASALTCTNNRCALKFNASAICDWFRADWSPTGVLGWIYAAPSSWDMLIELASALADDANCATMAQNKFSLKAKQHAMTISWSHAPPTRTQRPVHHYPPRPTKQQHRRKQRLVEHWTGRRNIYV